LKKHIPVLTAALFISLFIYVFYRTEKTLINQIFIMLFNQETYAFLKTRITFYLPLPDFVIYSLPEGLWVFCITLTSYPFYLVVRKRKWELLYVPILLALLMELCQLLHFAHGRFNWMDIIVSTGFWLLALLYARTNIGKEPLFQSVNITTISCVMSYLIVYLAHVNY
jgi:hypothetical protein